MLALLSLASEASSRTGEKQISRLPFLEPHKPVPHSCSVPSAHRLTQLDLAVLTLRVEGNVLQEACSRSPMLSAQGKTHICVLYLKVQSPPQLWCVRGEVGSPGVLQFPAKGIEEIWP